MLKMIKHDFLDIWDIGAQKSEKIFFFIKIKIFAQLRMPISQNGDISKAHVRYYEEWA